MDSAVNASLPKLLLQRSEGGGTPVLWGRDAAPHFGRPFERLLTAGILLERPPATAWPACRRCDGECGERDVIEFDGGLVAECPHYPAERARLAPHDIRSFSIAVTPLLTLLAKEAGVGDEPELFADGLWRLGQTTGGRAVFLLLSKNELSKPETLKLLASCGPLSAVTLLVPEAASAAELRLYRAAGCHTVRTAEALSDEGWRLRDETLAPGASHQPRLVINYAGPEIILDGRTLALTDQPSKLLVALAEKARLDPGFLGRRDVEAAVYENLTPPLSRNISDVVRVLRDQLAVGLAEPEVKEARALIVNRRPERYRLALPPEDIQVVGPAAHR